MGGRASKRGLCLVGLFLMSLLNGCRDVRREDGGHGTASPVPDLARVADAEAIYDPDPEHIWNRLHNHLFGRVVAGGRAYGLDTLDPPLWSETRYLLEGPSSQKALALLDEWLATHAERLEENPLKRAMMQRDLLATYMWAARQTSDGHPARDKLKERLTLAIRRLALSDNELNALPDNYGLAVSSGAFPAQPQGAEPGATFLPPNLFAPEGPWVCVARDDGTPAARVHTISFAGRSAFLVFLNLPGGRDATLAYLKQVADLPQLWIRDSRDPSSFVLNPQTPQLPTGTQFALVRRALLADERGELVPTSLVENIQLRVYQTEPEGAAPDASSARATQRVGEFTLSRVKLFAGRDGGLRQVEDGDEEFPHFMSHGLDPFEFESQDVQLVGPRPILRACATCHTAPGIYSLLSLQPHIRLVGATPADETDRSLAWQRHNAPVQSLRQLLP